MPSEQERAPTQILSSSVIVTGVQSELVSAGVTYRWRGPLTDAEMVTLVDAHGGRSANGWWDRIRPHSLGWVTARVGDATLVGFVNVVSDGGDHAFLIDTKTHGAHQHNGIGTRVVRFAARHAKAAGCEWLHVDFERDLGPFYFDACGFRPTEAGLIHLPSLPGD
ncbi:MAG: GNAT family N-acetyltransferase [Actinobacteria bacterium]|nr:GNAT family N-acetyltransferase [Actinomycetota bacterium]